MNYLNKFIADASINNDFKVVFDCNSESKLFTIKNTGKYKFTNKVLNNDIVKTSISQFGSPFVGAISGLKGKLIISLAEGKPVKLYEKTDDSAITIIVAPLDESA